MDLDDAKRAAEWMREKGIVRLRFRSEAVELELELDTSPAAMLGPLNLDAKPPEEHDPGLCIECQADAPKRYRPFCRQHWMAARGVVGNA